MKVIRPITLKDRQAFEEFASTVGLGVTSLPKNPSLLFQKLMNSLDSFSGKTELGKHPLYLFVLEDLTTGQLLGTSGIRVQTDEDEPIYFYRIEMDSLSSSLREVPSAIKILKPIGYKNLLTEICGLYILPNFRKAGNGRLLSLSRFLFMATFSQFFPETVIADMRGSLEDTRDLFWESIGRHFFDVSLNQALDLANQSRKFVPEILPKYPIYVPVLPKDVQAIIGQTHMNTKPALNLLKQEGFYFTDEVSIFDGGPKLEAMKSNIRAFKESVQAVVAEIRPQEENDTNRGNCLDHLISNQRLNFRACVGHVIKIDENKVSITAEVAKALEVEMGSQIRYMDSHPNSNSCQKSQTPQNGVSDVSPGQGNPGRGDASLGFSGNCCHQKEVR